ncbi:MAG: hypothetical protein H6807_07040 [Planctomycetes bacterium]|nr:hypothetical protein [Planctomycetota bacterium]
MTTTAGRARSETGRRLAHALFGLAAFALPVLDWRLAAGLAFLALLANLEFLPRTTIGRAWMRPDEPRLGGIVLYPLTVLLLVLIFRGHPVSAAAGFASLAFGDPMAAWAGRGARRRWPFNARKSPRGSLAFALTALVAVALIELGQGRSVLQALARALPPALVGAAIEASPWPRIDNLGVGLGAALAHVLGSPR